MRFISSAGLEEKKQNRLQENDIAAAKLLPDYSSHPRFPARDGILIAGIFILSDCRDKAALFAIIFSECLASFSGIRLDLHKT